MAHEVVLLYILLIDMLKGKHQHYVLLFQLERDKQEYL
ncbi:hypothetical protein CU037_0805 [Enterococcus faecium]|nr:hypothetical protein [Enterococcus faecium]